MDSETKYFIMIMLLFGLGSIITQSLLVPFIEINVWKPDVVLIVVLLSGRRFGSLKGSTAGFILGLLQDSLTSMPVGITAIPKVIAGYSSGKLRKFKVEGIYNFLWFLLFIFLHEVILYAFFQYKVDLSYSFLIYSRAFPNTIYSLVMLVVVHFFTQKYFSE